MTQRIDRDRKYATVRGDPVMGFLQDGIWYKHNGRMAEHQNYGSLPERGRPVAEKPKAVVVEQKPKEAKPKVDLDGMHVSKLKALAVKVAKATGADDPPMTGKGLKKTLIAYITENTT